MASTFDVRLFYQLLQNKDSGCGCGEDGVRSAVSRAGEYARLRLLTLHPSGSRCFREDGQQLVKFPVDMMDDKSYEGYKELRHQLGGQRGMQSVRLDRAARASCDLSYPTTLSFASAVKKPYHIRQDERIYNTRLEHKRKRNR